MLVFELSVEPLWREVMYVFALNECEDPGAHGAGILSESVSFHAIAGWLPVHRRPPPAEGRLRLAGIRLDVTGDHLAAAAVEPGSRIALSVTRSNALFMCTHNAATRYNILYVRRV